MAQPDSDGAKRRADQPAVVLAAAGSEGEGGTYGTGSYPMRNTIDSPADTHSVISVGAVSKAHGLTPDAEIIGPGVPSNLNPIGGASSPASTLPTQ